MIKKKLYVKKRNKWANRIGVSTPEFNESQQPIKEEILAFDSIILQKAFDAEQC